MFLQATQGCPGHQQVSTDPGLRPLAPEQSLGSGPCPGGDQQGTGQEGKGHSPTPQAPRVDLWFDLWCEDSYCLKCIAPGSLKI